MRTDQIAAFERGLEKQSLIQRDKQRLFNAANSEWIEETFRDADFGVPAGNIRAVGSGQTGETLTIECEPETVELWPGDGISEPIIVKARSLKS